MRVGHISPEKIVVIDGLHTAKRWSTFPACLDGTERSSKLISAAHSAAAGADSSDADRMPEGAVQREMDLRGGHRLARDHRLLKPGCRRSLSRLCLAGVRRRRTGKDSIPGTFHSVGGLDIPTTSSAIYVKAGWRRIGYTCPDHLTMDGPPTTTAVFEAGASYRLKCVASEAVIERIDGE